jgi:hypothetical protein
MGKLDIGVGDEFPVDDPPPHSQDSQETQTPDEQDRAAREEWRRQRDEWRQRKAEWRAQRDAFREDMRTRGRAFKADVRKSFHENFGDRVHGFRGGFMPRVLFVLAAIALTIALLPFLFMFGFLVIATALFIAAIVRGGRGGDFPRGTTQQ